MNVLLAGATGLVGFEVLKLLRAQGHTVRTVSRDAKRAEKLRAHSDDVRIADATAPGALDTLADGIDVIVSTLGAPVSQAAKDKRSFTDVDVIANRALIAEGERAGVRRFVYLSVVFDELTKDTAYVRAHTQVEDALRASKLSFTSVRPTGIYGALAELLDMAKKGPLPLIGGGTAKTNPIHELDVARALVSHLESGPETVEVGGPDALTRREIAEACFQALGKPPKFLKMPAGAMSLGGSLYRVFNPRMGEFLKFIVLVSTHDCTAPVAGKLRLTDYFAERVRS